MVMLVVADETDMMGTVAALPAILDATEGEDPVAPKRNEYSLISNC